MSLISLFYSPCKSWLDVEGELIWLRSSASIHKYLLSLDEDFEDPQSSSSRDTRLGSASIQPKQLFLQNRSCSSCLIKHIMCFFIIIFQLWKCYLHPRVPTEDSLCDGIFWGILCHINMTSEGFFNSCLGRVINKKLHKKGKIFST